MSDAIKPIDPMDPTGDGKSTAERMKRGMPNVDPEIQKNFAERLQKYIDEGKAEREARNAYTKNYTGNTRSGGGGGGGASGSDMSFMKGLGNKPNPTYKKGGKVKSASARADGCCIKGKTKGRIV
jgi:hypothetical protein